MSHSRRFVWHETQDGDFFKRNVIFLFANFAIKQKLISLHLILDCGLVESENIWHGFDEPVETAKWKDLLL